MEASGGAGKSPNTSLSFRYTANSDELEELCDVCDDDPPTPLYDALSSLKSETSSPKRTEKTTSILDKYFKSLKTEKSEDFKPVDNKPTEGNRSPPKDVTSSPMKEYLKNFSKRSASESPNENKEPPHTETWKIFHDFKFKITQAVEDMKTRSQEDNKEKSVPRDNSVSDSEENSAVKDSDHSVGDTDNQVSSLNSSIQNLSELTQPATTKPNDTSLPVDAKQNSESSDETHKNLDVSKYNDSSIEVESGIEALEDNFLPFEDTSVLKVDDINVNNFSDNKPSSQTLRKSLSLQSTDSLTTAKVGLITFSIQFYVLTLLLAVSFIVLTNWALWNGFLLGLWTFYFISQLKMWIVENYFGEDETYSSSFIRKKHSTIPTYTVPCIKEHRPLKKYEGWINHYRFPDYDPYTYHINKTATAFMKLEGTSMRISYTMSKIGKRALWDEKIEKVTFYQHRIYNLTGARVILLPKGLVRRRQWSKKYPICVILNDDEKIQVLEKESGGQPTERRVSESAPEKKKEAPETENIETNTSSPEKKRKFIWRKREKSISSHTEVEPGREGLRHRLVRKMHKEKKHETVSTNTSPPDGVIVVDKLEDAMVSNELDTETNVVHAHLTSVNEDEDLDEAELQKIKEFLEEAEGVPDTEGSPDTEWSLHVKHSKEHSHLFLFGRTGREKQEWFRRLSVAISEANTSTANSGEQSANEDKSFSESEKDKEGIELAVYHHHATEKECVSISSKGTSKSQPETTVDGAASPTAQTTPQPTLYDYFAKEETFWSYFLKIVQTKSPSPSCDCRILSSDVQWLNMTLARIVFDVMNDSEMKARLQTKIQKKLQTLKLPSFMSPLLVTALSLAGSCPLVERVCCPAWDERGLWLDMDVLYAGGAFITILTQINLMKLKEKNINADEQPINAADASETDSTCANNVKQRSKPAIYDSEVEDSAESSSDDETPPLQPVDSGESVPLPEPATANEPPGSSKKKFLRIVDRIATNKYFQTVTDYKYVKRAMEGLSNTDIKLHVEIQGLEGRLTVNLPTPPHDRLWIGFRTNPLLVLKARPTVGARTLRFAHISNWIEEKLTKEFEKVLVLPNMEDFIIDVMTPTPIDFE